MHNNMDVKNHEGAGKEAIIGEDTFRKPTLYKVFGISQCHSQQKAESSRVSLGWECCGLDVYVLPSSLRSPNSPV